VVGCLFELEVGVKADWIAWLRAGDRVRGHHIENHDESRTDRDSDRVRESRSDGIRWSHSHVNASKDYEHHDHAQTMKTHVLIR
jgi:hypothetical protein